MLIYHTGNRPPIDNQAVCVCEKKKLAAFVVDGPTTLSATDRVTDTQRVSGIRYLARQRLNGGVRRIGGRMHAATKRGGEGSGEVRKCLSVLFVGVFLVLLLNVRRGTVL